MNLAILGLIGFAIALILFTLACLAEGRKRS